MQKPNESWLTPPGRKCACGCGGEVKPDRYRSHKYLNGHNGKLRIIPPELWPTPPGTRCECGCDKEVTPHKNRITRFYRNHHNTKPLELSEEDLLKPCGTHAAYVRHIRNRERPCDECAGASRLYAKERYDLDKAAHKLRTMRYRDKPERKAMDFELRMKRYGISVEEWAWKFQNQNFSCGICGDKSPGAKDWHTDHDHSCCTGRLSCGNCFRGILCSKCNQGLGSFIDNESRLLAAIQYLHQKERNEPLLDHNTK